MILKNTIFSNITNRTGAPRALFLSDVHLLHRRTPTRVIIENFWHLVTPEVMSSIDAMYIAGDLWDDSKQLRQEETGIALEFLTELIQKAKEFNFGLRVLEGTPSHDHGQSKIINVLNMNVGADVVYLEGIGIWTDPKLNMTVGYVQDEYKPNAKETEKEMNEMMKTRGIKQVDFFVMHGCFTFQLPVFSERSFTERFWIKRARYAIFIGHDHHPKTYEIIRVTGSFDRLSSNEEEDKGMTLCDFIEGEAHCYFIPNFRAVPYMQVKGIRKEEVLYAKALETLKYVDEHYNGRHGQVSIEHAHDSSIVESIRRWNKEYNFNVKGVKLPDPMKATELEMAFEAADSFETISCDNLAELLFAEMDETLFDKTLAMEILDMVA